MLARAVVGVVARILDEPVAGRRPPPGEEGLVVDPVLRPLLIGSGGGIRIQQAVAVEPGHVLDVVPVVVLRRAVHPVVHVVVVVDGGAGAERRRRQVDQRDDAALGEGTYRERVGELVLEQREGVMHVVPGLRLQVVLLPQVVPVRQELVEREVELVDLPEPVQLAVVEQQVEVRLLLDQLGVVRHQVLVFHDVDEDALVPERLEVGTRPTRALRKQHVRQVAALQHQVVLGLSRSLRDLRDVEHDVGLLLEPLKAEVPVLGPLVGSLAGMLGQRDGDGDLLFQGKGDRSALLHRRAFGFAGGPAEHARECEQCHDVERSLHASPPCPSVGRSRSGEHGPPNVQAQAHPDRQPATSWTTAAAMTSWKRSSGMPAERTQRQMHSLSSML